jgi:Phage tail assembly chaperone proteins, E, or 41 or 14
MTTRTYTLKHPIEIKGKDGELLEKIESITLNRLLGKHARQCTASAAMPLMVQMIGCSAGLPPSTMDKMDLEDIIAAGEVAGDFLGAAMAMQPKPEPSQLTGGKS